jgi:hypothetical protein
MMEKINLADPNFEPTDEQLMQLSREAFAGIQKTTEENNQQLRTRIAHARAEAFKRFQARK